MTKGEARTALPASKERRVVLCFGGFNAVEGQREARFVAVARVLVEHAFRDGAVDCGHGRLEKVAGGGGINRGDRGAQTPHECADPGAIRAVHVGTLTRLRRPLQDRLLALLNFGSLSLGHLLLLVRSAQTFNLKRGVLVFDVLLSPKGEDSYGVSLVFARSLRRVPTTPYFRRGQQKGLTFGLPAHSPIKEF